jgi:hypothetical protein
MPTTDPEEEPLPTVEDYAAINHCPRCGSEEITSFMHRWPAYSEEDPANTAVLWEHQCRTCEGFSFWTGTGEW